MFIDPDSVTDCFADLRSELNKAHNFIKEGSIEDAKNAIEKVSFGLRIMESIFDCALLEAAADLGCPPWKAFLRVTLPLSVPGVVAGFVFVFIPTLGEWVTPALVGGVKGMMYGNIIQDQFGRALNWPMGSLMSLVMLVAVLLLLGVFAWVARALHIDLGAA